MVNLSNKFSNYFSRRYINTESSVLVPSSPPPKMDDLPPPPPQLNTSDGSDVSFPTPPPPMSPDFPSPPMSPPVPDATLEAEPPIGSSEKLHGELSRTSSAGSAPNEDDSQSEEEDLDFTDADKAIDKMLDDLEDFQMVGRNAIYFFIYFIIYFFID